MQRQPNSGKESRCLLEHGLSLTHLPALEQWVLRSSDAAASADRLNLRSDQLLLCKQRALLAQYRQRLTTHQEIHRGYNRLLFAQFRDANDAQLLEQALRAAAESKISVVKLLLSYHGTAKQGNLLPFQLQILKSIPETTSPKNYAELLPAVTDSSVQLAEQLEWSAEDYVQTSSARDLWMPHQSAAAEQSGHDLVAVGELTEWYKARAIEMDELTGQLYNSNFLLCEGACLPGTPDQQTSNLGILCAGMLIWSSGCTGIKKGVPGLQELRSTVEDLIKVIENGSASVDMTITAFAAMDPEQKLKYYLGNLTADTVVDTLLGPAKSTLQTDTSMLAKFLVSKSLHELEIPASVFKANGSNNFLIKEGLFESEENFILTALECVYSCERTDMWAVIDAIFESLPVRREGRIEPVYLMLHELVDQLETQLNVATKVSARSFHCRCQSADYFFPFFVETPAKVGGHLPKSEGAQQIDG